jgi:hypothetical protein
MVNRITCITRIQVLSFMMSLGLQSSTYDVKSAGIPPFYPDERLMCRRVLASSSSFLIHTPPEEMYQHKHTYAQAAAIPRARVDSILPAQCAHFFLEPQDWMQQTIDQGELEGKLECPKCTSKVGAYAWQGMRCSCGVWVTPCFSLAKSKVDEVKRVTVSTLNGVMKPKLGIEPVKSKV